MDKRYFIVLATQRSGSSYLCDLLEANKVGSPREHFDGRHFDSPFSSAFARGISTQDYARFLVGREKGDIFGTKLFWEFCEPMLANARPLKSGMHELLTDLFPGATWILISRKDKVDQAVSLARALDSGEWFKVDRGASPEQARAAFSISANRLHRHVLYTIQCEHHWRKMLMEANQGCMEVDYDALCRNPRDVIERIGRTVVGDSFAATVEESRLRVQRDEESERIKTEYLSCLRAELSGGKQGPRL